jgi:hypothetical protein
MHICLTLIECGRRVSALVSTRCAHEWGTHVASYTTGNRYHFSLRVRESSVNHHRPWHVIDTILSIAATAAGRGLLLQL